MFIEGSIKPYRKQSVGSMKFGPFGSAASRTIEDEKSESAKWMPPRCELHTVVPGSGGRVNKIQPKWK